MTGSEFKALFEDYGYSLTSISKALEVSEKTIFNQSNKNEVKALYEYALRYLILEKHIHEFTSNLESGIDGIKKITTR